MRSGRTSCRRTGRRVVDRPDHLRRPGRDGAAVEDPGLDGARSSAERSAAVELVEAPREPRPAYVGGTWSCHRTVSSITSISAMNSGLPPATWVGPSRGPSSTLPRVRRPAVRAQRRRGVRVSASGLSTGHRRDGLGSQLRASHAREQQPASRVRSTTCSTRSRNVSSAQCRSSRAQTTGLCARSSSSFPTPQPIVPGRARHVTLAEQRAEQPRLDLPTARAGLLEGLEEPASR